MHLSPPRRALAALTAPALALSLTLGASVSASVSAQGQATLDAPATTNGWTALPAETIACLRMPDTRGFLAALRADTVLGQRVLTEDRLAGFVQLFKDENPEDWAEFENNLEGVGLTPDELTDLAQEPWGVGWVMAPSVNRERPRSILIGWADLDEDAIDKLEAALDRTEGDREGVLRTDLELSGVVVRQYAVPKTDGGDTPSDYSHLLITRLPGRIVAALGLPESEEAAAQAIAAGEDVDWDAVTDLETVHGVLARYLDDTAAGGAQANGFTTRMAAVPGVAAATAMQRGEDTPTAAEFFLDVPRVVTLVEESIAREQGPEQAANWSNVAQALALNDLGMFATSAFASEAGLQFSGFMGAPAPRRGLAGLLDGTTLPAAPPAWVPADVGYVQLAFDLGKVWDLALTVAEATGGPPAVQQLQQYNAMAGGVLQADIPSALRSLGTAHRVISSDQTVIGPDGEPMQPTAFVWEPGDPGVLQRLFAFAKQSMGVQPGVEIVQEQGFDGLRFEQEGVSGAALLGPNHLIAGVGGNIVDRLLPLFSNPPAPADAMVGSDVFRNGEDLLTYREGFLFQFSDGGRDLVNVVRQAMTAVLTEGSTDPEIAQRFADLLPEDEDLRASLGASVGQMYLSEGGIVIEGGVVTPAAE